jgi:hypothetical protein
MAVGKDGLDLLDLERQLQGGGLLEEEVYRGNAVRPQERFLSTRAGGRMV